MKNGDSYKLFENFKKYNPYSDEDVVCFENYGGRPEMLLVHLNDGTVIRYDDSTRCAEWARNIKELTTRDYCLEDDVWRKSFQHKLNRIMENAEITQEQLACEVGVSTGTMSNWLNGKIIPPANKIAKLARVLRCDGEELLNLLSY